MAAPVVRPSGQTANLELLQNRLSALYREIGLSFPAGQRSVAALVLFNIRGTEVETSLFAFINESALMSLSGNPGLSLVERRRRSVTILLGAIFLLSIYKTLLYNTMPAILVGYICSIIFCP